MIDEATENKKEKRGDEDYLSSRGTAREREEEEQGSVREERAKGRCNET